MRALFAFIIMVLIVSSTSAKAATLRPEDYFKLRMLFSEGRVAVMSDEERDYYLDNYDFDEIITAHKYFKVVETSNGTTSTEVTEAEAIMGSNMINNGDATNGPTHTTTYKKLHISATHLSGNGYEIRLYEEWLLLPSVRSYDVIGIRLYDGTVQSGSQDGTQTYKQNGNFYYINYSATGTNIVTATNGYGISMNLVDDSTYYSCDTTSVVYATSALSEVYGSYQHAIYSVSLSDSQSYSISHNGYGGVFNFATGVMGAYDGMAGVSLSLPYYS